MHLPVAMTTSVFLCFPLSFFLSLFWLCLPVNANNFVQEILITVYLIFQSRARYYRTATNLASLRPVCYSRNKKSSYLEAYQIGRYEITLAPLSIMPYSRALRPDLIWNVSQWASPLRDWAKLARVGNYKYHERHGAPWDSPISWRQRQKAMGRRCRLWDQVRVVSDRARFHLKVAMTWKSQEKLHLEIRDIILKEKESESSIQNVWSRHIPKDSATFVHNHPIRAIYTIVESAISISHRDEPRTKWTCRQRLILIGSIETVNSWHLSDI